MVRASLLIQIYLVILFVNCERPKEKKGKIRHFGDNEVWKNEYEEELTNAMVDSRRSNMSRASTNKLSDNEVVLDKLLESITSSEKYLKKVDNIDFRLNRMDVEFHEKTNTIIAHLTELLKQLQSSTIIEKVDTALEVIKGEISSLKTQVARGRTDIGMETYNQNPTSYQTESADFSHDSALDSRLSGMENSIKSIQSSVDTVVTIINEVKNRRYPKGSKQEENPISGTIDALGLITEFRKTLMSPKKKCECNRSGRVDRSERFPTDCFEIQMQGFNISGIYKIKPDDSEPFYVLCDLVTAGGGWTVFQNRFDGTQDFYKGWSDYKHGFGNLAGEFWLGLEKLSYLTNQKLYELRVEMGAGHGQEGYAGFSVFTVGPEHESYRISTLGTYRGNAGDSLTYHAGQKFSTFDMDNDEWADGSCSSEHGGAWWYKECDKSNLNGKYTMTPDENRGQTIYWISFKGPTTPLMKTKMMIRPLPATRPTESDHVRKLESSSPRLSQEKQVLRGSSSRPIKFEVPGPSRQTFRFDRMKHNAFFHN